MNVSLDGFIAWVTGASGGIGRATSLLLAQCGATIIVSDVNLQSLDDLNENVKKFGGNCLTLPLDVSDQIAVEKAGIEIENKFGKLDILVNCAGISPKESYGRVSIEETSKEEWNKVLDVNLNGSFYCSQIAIRKMKKQGAGHIVNISSQAGRTYSEITGAHYAASKAALISLTRQMAGELGPYGINVNAVSPGRIDTEMIQDVDASVNENIMDMTPLRRLGTAEEVAQSILFLTSSLSSYITGAVIDVNGGRLMI